MNTLRVPQVLWSILQREPAYAAWVQRAFSTFEPWLVASGLPLFPDYTDHGPTHVNAVMESAAALARKEALELLSPLDAALVCLSALLHDSAMHLSEDGFDLLVSGRWPQPDGAEKSWPDAWDEFLLEASRFDGRQLIALFGDVRPVTTRPKLSHPETSRRDRLLAGEFVRRHHSRLAHEIALHGVPGPSTDRLVLGAPSDELAHLVGLIARSHGMPLRNALADMDSEDRRTYRGSHPAFLMVLLRVADYLQLEATRAPAGLLQVKRISAGSSVKEWDAHKAIVDIRHTHADPEALHVTLSPSVSAEAYFVLRQRLFDIQRELDDCWAVLGETYGRFESLHLLGLRIRRIYSNLADPRFVSRLPYLPVQATFSVGNPDLLTLLVGPLYNGDPIFAIRELLQNAVDACVEHADILGVHDGESHRVVVSLRHQNANRWLDVDDNGVGMSLDVVLSHFLNAGSSFCQSRHWHERHRDTAGLSRVPRSGRFGVGVLAAYLVGDQISVSTKSDNHPGVAFDAALTDERIQLRPVDRPRGTTVSVKIRTPAIWKFLIENARQWDWYQADYPTVTRRLVDGDRATTIVSTDSVPHLSRPASGPWRRLPAEGRDAVDWTYTEGPALICNGIVIGSSSDDVTSTANQRLEQALGVRAPRLSIWDRESRLPINLQRTAVAPLALREVLERVRSDIWLDYVAYLLAVTPDTRQDPLNHRALFDIASHPGVRDNLEAQVAITNLGLTGLTSWHLRLLRATSALVVPRGVGARGGIDWSAFDLPGVVVPVEVTNLALRSITREADGVGGFRAGLPVPVCGARVLYPQGSLRGSVWKVVTFGVAANSGTDLIGLAKAAGLADHEWVAEVYFENNEAYRRVRFSDAWRSLLDTPVIPYDMNARLLLCSAAISRSSEHLRALEAEGTIAATLHRRLIRSVGRDW